MQVNPGNIPCGACSYDPTLPITGSWILELPVVAVSANYLKGNVIGRAHWNYKRIRGGYMEALLAQCRNIPEATEKRRVFFIRNMAGKTRPYDTDNLSGGMKPLRDCLTKLKLIKNDNASWLEAHYFQRRAEVNSVTINIETCIWRTPSSRAY